MPFHYCDFTFPNEPCHNLYVTLRIVPRDYRYVTFQIVPRHYRYVAVTGGQKHWTNDEARTECSRISSGLAIVRNQSDLEALHETMVKSNVQNHVYKSGKRNYELWLDGRFTLGQWRWSTGEEFSDEWFDVFLDQPDDVCHFTSCIIIDVWLRIKCKLCSIVNANFICE